MHKALTQHATTCATISLAKHEETPSSILTFWNPTKLHEMFCISMGYKTHLTAYKTYVSSLSTTPSTPLHDAHQEGYSFIEVASHFICTQTGATSE